MRTEPPITFLNLLRKYGGNIMRAHELELKAAVRAVPAGKSKWQHLSDAAHNYKLECKRKYKRICTNKDGLCEEDKCCCY